MAGELNRSGLEWVNADHPKPTVVFHLVFLDPPDAQRAGTHQELSLKAAFMTLLFS
jgi:hypothetical protein